MQILSILSALFTAILAVMNYHNTVSVYLLSPKFANMTGLSVHTFTFDMAMYTICMFILGLLVALLFIAPLYKSLKDKYLAYKRELEKGSITNTSSQSKIQVLENKITVLEKALDDALKRKN